MVLCIFIFFTTPVKIRPRIRTSPVKVITSDNDGSLHLHFLHNSGQNTSTDKDVSGEGAFFVDVGSLSGLPRHLEAESDGAHVLLLRGGALLVVVHNRRLLLKSLLHLRDFHICPSQSVRQSKS